MAFFTREQILEIATRLAQLGVSDTELEQVSSINGSEQFAIVKDGTSYRTTLSAVSSLISTAVSSTELDIFNVTRYEMEQQGSSTIIAMTFAEALAAVPSSIKRLGQILTYYDSGTSAWRMWRFKGTNINTWNTQSSWEEFTAASSLATVASTGDYNDLINKKTKVSDFTNDAGYLTEHQSLSAYTPTAELAPVALSNDYDDLTHKITKVSDLTNDSGFVTTTTLAEDYYDKDDIDDTFATKTALAEKADASDIPSLDGYATQEWVGEQGYKTTVSWSDLEEDGTHKFVSAAEKASWTAKQDAITGAATTILSSNLTANKAIVVNSSGKIIASDITTTELSNLSGASSNIQTQLNGKQATIADLSDIREGAALAASAYQLPSGGIPSTDLSSSVQASLAAADSAYQIPNGGIPNSDLAGSITYDKLAGSIPATKLDSSVQSTLQDLTTAVSAIPASASSSNKLVDTSTMNSTVATATATFRGTSDAGLSESQFLSWANNLTKDLNDYVYWNTEDVSGNTLYKRYKYNGSSWAYEYSLNNSSFTAAQWAAINSGVTAAKITTYDGQYTKPSGGIPDIDLTSSIRTSLGKADTAYQLPSGGMLKSSLAAAVQASLDKADSAYQKPNGGIPESDLDSTTQSKIDRGNTAYQVPSGGIPATALESALQIKIETGASAYQKPSGGVPSTDMTAAVQISLGKADTAYQVPSGGIPYTDLDSRVQASLDLAGTCAQSSNTYTKTQVDTLLAPKAMTTAQIQDMSIRQLPTGTCVFNTTTGKPYWFNGTDWRDSSSSGTITPDERNES